MTTDAIIEAAFKRGATVAYSDGKVWRRIRAGVVIA